MKQNNIFGRANRSLTAVGAAVITIVMLLTAAVQGARADEWPAYISEVKLIGGTEAKTNSLKSTYGQLGWKVIDYNLNLNCKSGSDYIYLLYLPASNRNIDGGYITDFYISDHSGASSLPETVTFNNKEYTLCEYAGDDHFVSIKGDLNSYAGGSDIHLYYTKANFTDKRAVAAITFDANSDNALPWNGNGTTAADLNKGCGSGSAYIYMHLTTATKTYRPKSDPEMKTGLVYNGQAQRLVMTAATIDNGTMYYRVGTSGSFTTNIASLTATNAGTHTVSYYADGDRQIGDPSDTHSQTVSIGKSPNNGLSVTIASIIDKGATLSPTLIGTNLSTGTVTFLYAPSASGSYTATVPTAPGSYWVKATIAADNNCDAFTTQAVNFRIMPWQGSGTAASPYLIETTDDLRQLSTDANGGNKYNGTYFRLENNLDFQPQSAWDDLTREEDNFTAIGNFYGHFDGGGNTISGIRINKGNTSTQGLFSVIGEGGEVSNLTLANTRIVGGSYTGGIAGHNWSGTISNCHVTATVDIHATNNSCLMHGGIVGENNTKEGSNIVGTVSGCTSAAQLTMAGGIKCYDFGGIAGFNYYGTLTGNLAIGANVAKCVDSRHGAIVGRNSYATLTNNYYCNCNVKGCNGNDINGAMPVCSLTLGAGISATTTATPVTFTYGGTTANYYSPGTVFTLTGGLDALANPDPGYRKGYVTTAGTISYDADTNSYTFTLLDDAAVSATNHLLIDWADESSGDDADHAYLIYNAEQLDLVAQRVNGSTTNATFGSKYYRLMSDIEYDATQENNYTAIGSESNPFRGHFDGGSHAVWYIHIINSLDYQGLFGCIGQGGEVRNVVVSESDFCGNNHVGCIAGYNNGGTLANNYYYNCRIGSPTIPFGTPTPMGCDGADIYENDGAMEVFKIWINNNSITIETSPSITTSGVNYYKKGLLITLSGQPENAAVNEFYGYTLNGATISGNSFTVSSGGVIDFSSSWTQLTTVKLASGITATPLPLKSDGSFGYYMPGTTIELSGGTPATPAPNGYAYPYTVNDIIISGNTFEVSYAPTSVDFSSTPILVSPNAFISAGSWEDDDNWKGGYVPAAGSDVFICADVTVPSGYLADAGTVTVLDDATITVEDGGQLKLTNSDVMVSMKKSVVGQDESESNYYFIASPVARDIQASDVENMMSEGNTLLTLTYSDNEDLVDLNWDESLGTFWQASTTLENVKGYMYASKSDATLTFTGPVRPTDKSVTVLLSPELDGWNLVGNPFPCSAYIVWDGPIYRMNSEGNGFEETESHVLAPMEAVLLKVAEEGGKEVTLIPDFGTDRPLLVLKDNEDNSGVIQAAIEKSGQCDVLLLGRTLYKDGRWNTLCLPFDISLDADNPLDGAEVWELDLWGNGGFDHSLFQLPLSKVEKGQEKPKEVAGQNHLGKEMPWFMDYMEAGKPYLVRWVNTEVSENQEDMMIVNPLFRDVEISSKQPATVTTGSKTYNGSSYGEDPEKLKPGSVSFIGTYNPVTFTTADYEVPFMDEGSTLGACRAYFKINGLKEVIGDPDMALRGLTTTENGNVYINDIAELPETLQVVKLYPQYVHRGDVNGDGKVTPADAIMILYRYFGVLQNGFIWRAADLNGDDGITPADAIEALYKYFGAGSNGARATRPMETGAKDPE